jgi:hypothetical protein
MHLNVFKNRKGSALLVALLMMGVMTAISLVLSVLILRELRVTRDLIDSGKAYYAAESAVEIALFELNHSLPGWEPVTDDDEFKSYSVADDAVAELKVDNRCKAYPCFDEDFDLSKESPPNQAFYDVLELNENITIPLFVVDEGEEVPVGDFVVEFYAPFDPSKHLKIDGQGLTGWDVLRWKVFGLRQEEPKVTETISDFTAIKTIDSAAANKNTEDESTNATAPSWFGSRETGCADVGNRYTDSIVCFMYKEIGEVVSTQAAGFDGETDSDDGYDDLYSGELDGDVRSDIYDVGCWPYEAREFYLYDYAFGERTLTSEGIHPCYLISSFMDDHDLKYLSLTNLINPAVLKGSHELETTYGITDMSKLERLFFRVEFFADGEGTGNETEREYADITAKGYSGDNAQTIEVKIKRGSFIPVFNFSLYSTYKSGENINGEKHDYEYWYGDDEDSGLGI